MSKIVKLMTAVAFVLIAHALFAYNGGYENSLDYKLYPGVGYANNELTAREESGATIAANRYAQCKKLKSVDLTGVTSIGDAAFAYSALESVTIPASVQSMGFIAFGGCANLKSVTVSNWNWYDANKEPFRDCDALTELVALCEPPSWDVASVFANVKKVSCSASCLALWKDHVGASVEVVVFSCKLTCDANGGGPVSTYDVHYGTGELSGIGWYPAEKTGSKLSGWYDAQEGGELVYDAGGKCVDGTYWQDCIWHYCGDVTVYARWVSLDYTLTVDPNNGAAATAYTVTVGLGNFSGIGWYPAKKAGFRIVGWYSALAGGELVYDANGNCVNGTYWQDGVWQYYGNVTVYARWETVPGDYTLTVNPNNGKAATAYTVTVGLGNFCGIGWYPAEKPGFKLIGWYDALTGGELVYDASGNCVEGTYWKGRLWNYGGDVTVYARWESSGIIPTQGEPATVSSAGMVGGQFKLTLPVTSGEYGVWTNADLSVPVAEWGLMEKKQAEGTPLEFSLKVIPNVPQLFFRAFSVEYK